jgi:hypothetical protein
MDSVQLPYKKNIMKKQTHKRIIFNVEFQLLDKYLRFCQKMKAKPAWVINYVLEQFFKNQ